MTETRHLNIWQGAVGGRGLNGGGTGWGYEEQENGEMVLWR